MSAPVKHTCPAINKYIKSIRQEIVKERDLKRMNENELYDAAATMSSELENCIDYLEDLRKSNDELRTWGEELEKNFNSASDDIYWLEQKVDELTKQGV